jgi:cobalamin biosynthesis Co2+ chelatase CbiK
MSNLGEIRNIQAKYLKHIEDEMVAERMIDENAEVADDDQDA